MVIYPNGLSAFTPLRNLSYPVPFPDPGEGPDAALNYRGGRETTWAR